MLIDQVDQHAFGILMCFSRAEQTFHNAISTWGRQGGLDTVMILVKEFWPDIHRNGGRIR